MKRKTIFYATRSKFKNEELAIISAESEYLDPKNNFRKIGELIDFRISSIPTDEPLEINLEEMVRHKARSAYKRLLAPCIVEHAGLILEKNAKSGFPGGLTQPMWDALSADDFLARLGCGGERATARAVIGFCDGMQTVSFVGETRGTIASEPRGSREFYWDVIFCPEEGKGKTYAEISEGKDGLKEKLKISQSTKAISEFAKFLATQKGGSLFDLS